MLGNERRGALATSMQESLNLDNREITAYDNISSKSFKSIIVFIKGFFLHTFPDGFYRTPRRRVREPDLTLKCSTETKQNSRAVISVWLDTGLNLLLYFLLGNEYIHYNEFEISVI